MIRVKKCYTDPVRKKCVKCRKTKLIDEFNFKIKITGRRNGRCKECTRADIRAAYRKNRKHYLAYRAVYNKRRRDEVVAFLLNHFSQHSCVDCGITDPVVLEFDHVRGKKTMAVSRMISQRYPLDIIKKEIEKCDVRCRNCHIRKTARQFGHYALAAQKELL